VTFILLEASLFSPTEISPPLFLFYASSNYGGSMLNLTLDLDLSLFFLVFSSKIKDLIEKRNEEIFS
jgi:hypothetical protein